MQTLIASCFVCVRSHDLKIQQPNMSVQDQVAIANLLDKFHSSAADADLESYISCFSADGRFLGTDPCENWHVDEFRQYARQAFESGKGWKYVCLKRKMTVYDNVIACFDENLASERFGHARGTGTLRLEGGSWKILQYYLSFPVPNDIAGTVTDMVRAHYSEGK